MTRSIEAIVADRDKPSTRHPGQHWIFDAFAPFRGTVPAGANCDFIGSLTATDLDGAWAPLQERAASAAIPSVGEAYFEWIDLLEAIHDARRSFVFFEVGAGYGCWTARALKGAAQRGLVERSGVLVEADPRHAALIRRHMAANGFAEADYRLVEAAIDRQEGFALFCIATPDANSNRQDSLWYGQFIANLREGSPLKPSGESYAGQPVLEIAPGWGAIKVATQRLSRLVSAYAIVDLVDLDIQGKEIDAVGEARDALTRHVRRLHIGTHSRDIEEGLRQILGGAGWLCLRDYKCNSVTETPFGVVPFQDGVQSWINPSLDAG